MDSSGNKKNGTIKEEGELTDDDDGHEESFMINTRSTFLSREVSRHLSSEQIKNLESRNRFSPKRKEYRRRAEVDIRRSSRATADGGLKKHHREHQASTESYTPSKFWANRRFRASSVRPLSPKHAKSSGPRRTDSPQLQKYRGGHDSSGECQDELERLEKEQRRIREQLKCLEEEEENDGNDENNCVLETLDARSEAEELATPFSGTSNGAALNYIIENEKSEDEDIGLQELRRLALATSERHIRLMAIEPQTSLPGIPSSDIVVIPDVEPDLPEPEVVMVDEEEEFGKDKNLQRQPVTASLTSPSLIASSPSKKKSKKSSKLKKKGQSNSDVHSKERVKSKVTLPSPKKSKTKRRKKEEMKQGVKWMRQQEELRILVMDDPAKALEKLLQFATEWEGKKRPIVTGTIKDFKRQKHIPVISDKRAVQNFSQQAVKKKNVILEKLKELKEQDKKSGQLQDNYEEVEMDIDSNADDEGESSNFGGLQFGDDFNQAMLPLSSYQSGNYQQNQQPALTTSITPPPVTQPFHISAPLPFDAVILPPIPPPIPVQPLPPLPPHPEPPQPPAYEHDSLWKTQHALLEERIAQIMDKSRLVNNTISMNPIYPEEIASLYHRHEENHNLLDATFLEINLPDENKTALNASEDVNSSLFKSGSSLDDDIGRRLRMIRKNQDSHDSQDVNISTIIPVLPGIFSSVDPDRSTKQNLIPLTGSFSSTDEKKTSNLGTELHPSVHMRRTDHALACESEGLQNYLRETLSRQRNHSDRDKYGDLSELLRKSPAMKTSSYRSDQDPSRRIVNDRSPSPPRRIFPKKVLRNCLRERSGSPHSPVYSRRLPLTSVSKHRDESYSPPQRPSSRDSFRDHYNERSTASFQHRTHKLQHEDYLHMSSSPHHHVRRSSSTEGADIYQPEVPPTKKIRRSSPPPYIPTSIRIINTSHTPQQDVHHSSDVEEEDPAALRIKLLAEVTQKRRATAEAPSNNTTPSAVSPRQDSTHSEISCVADLQDEHTSRHQDTSLKATSTISHIKEEDDDEEDVQPPPVISRVSRHLSKPPSLREICKKELNMTDQRGQSRPQTEEQIVQQPVLNHLGSNLDMEILEEDNDDLSKSDLETLRAYVIRAQTHAPERMQHSAAVEDIEVKDNLCNKFSPSSTYDEVSALPVFFKNQSDSSVTVSSSLSKVEPHHKNPQLPSRNNHLLKSSSATTESVKTSDHDGYWSHLAQDGELIPSCPVSSTNTTSEYPWQTTCLTYDIKAAEYVSPSEPSQLNPPFASSEHPTLSSTAIWVQPTKDIAENCAVIKSAPPFKHIPTTSTAHIPASNLDQRLDSVSTFSAQTGLNKTSMRPQTPQETSMEVQQQQTNLGLVDKNKFISKSVSKNHKHVTKDPTNLLTGVNTSVKLSAVDQSTAMKTVESIPQSLNIRHVVDSEPPSTFLPYTERPGLSSYSSQYSSSASSAGAWKYSNVHILPVHPQVLVPVNSSSGSDGDSEDDVGKHPKKKAVLTADDIDMMILNTNGMLTEAQYNEKAASQLTAQEKQLSIQELSIQKEQRAVKLLVKRAVKFLEAQQKEEEKQEVFRSQLRALSHKMKTSENFVMLLKAEKEQTEKQVQLVTEKLLQKKNMYERKAKSVISLGTKLLGPAYVPRIIKPHEVRSLQESTSQEKQSLTRAQEKLKLMEKEKQIAEKLKKLKEAQPEKGKLQAVKNMSGPVISSGSKWKSKDVIRIDKDLKPDISITPRRRSLLEMNPSTTPNIPLTPRRSTSVSNTEKENIVSETVAVELNSEDKEARTGFNSTFRMPGGTLLANFCQLQKEKALEYLRQPDPSSSSADTCFYPSLSGLQTSTTVKKIRLHASERHRRHSQDANRPFHSTPKAYSSPLLMFRSYRFNSYFRTKENRYLQSSTYSNKINPNNVLCPYDLQGTCNDDSCQQQHPKDYKFSDHELLVDIISYCPRLAGAKDGSSPKEVEKCIVTFVDSLLSKHKGKMTIDDLSLWLLSQVNEASGRRHPHSVSLEKRLWRPHPKEETGLSLDLSQQLNSHKVEAINVDRKVADKDTVVSGEDMRYFAADLTEILMLEVSIMEDQTNIQLWQKLASKKLYDPNKSPKECLEQALSVLSRGLEINKNDPDLWHMYLTLYRRHSEVKDFPEFCQTALEYAPSYALFFLYLDSLKTFSEKDEVCMQALQFLCNLARDRRTKSVLNISKSQRARNANNLKGALSDAEDVLEGINISEITDGKFAVETTTLSDIHESTDKKVERKVIMKMQENNDERLCVEEDSGGETEANLSSFDRKTLSHQMLEMLLYKTCLHIQAGKTITALNYLQMVLELKRHAHLTPKAAEYLTSADHLVLWLVYIYVLEWQQMPQQLYSVNKQNTGRLMAKENITLSWSTKASLHNGVDYLVDLHNKAARVWECCERDEEAAVYYVKLMQSQVSLLVSQNRHSEAVTKLRSVLLGNQLVDVWLTMADLIASCQDKESVKQVFSEALSIDRYSPKLQFYHCVFLHQQGETELAMMNLDQFAISHFNTLSRNPLHCDPGQLYSQLLKQQESISLQAAQVNDDVSDNVHKDIFMWLCYSLWLETKGRANDAVEVFERSLTHACLPDDLVLVWQNYISFLARSRTPPKDVREIIIRSLISTPTKFPVPFSPDSSAMWVNYYHINRLVEAWLAVLSPTDTLDFMELCIGFMPSNIQLLLRALYLCLDVKETRRAYSWCKFVAVQTDRPANLAFWKMATALAQVEGMPREVENMMIGCVETIPLAVSGWKDFLLFEVTRENMVAVQKLLTCCQQLELNVEGFVATLSAS